PDPELLGVEVEISPAGADGNREHKEVLQRTTGPATVNVLVYDNLPEGQYTLWIGDVAWARHIRIENGSIAELDLRGSAPALVRRAVETEPPRGRRVMPGAPLP